MQHRIAKVPEDEFTHDIEHVEAMEIPALASPLPPIPPSPAPKITDWNIWFDDTDGLRDFCTWDVHTEIYSAWGGDGDDWVSPPHASSWHKLPDNTRNDCNQYFLYKKL